MVAMDEAEKAAIKMYQSSNGTNLQIPKVLKCSTCGKENPNAKFTNMRLFKVFTATQKAKLSFDCPEEGCGSQVYFVCAYKRKRKKPRLR